MSQAHLRLYRWLNQILPHSYTLKFAAISLLVISFAVLVSTIGIQTLSSNRQQLTALVLISHGISYALLILLIWHLLAPVRLVLDLFEAQKQGHALPENLPASYDTAGLLMSKVVGLLTTLESKQQSFDMLFQAIPDGLACFDRDGVCLTVKEPSYFQFVYDAQQLVGKTLIEYYGDTGRSHEYYRQQFWQTGELQTYEFELEVDGQLIFREYRVFALSEQESVTFVRDISEQRRIAKQLEASEATFRTFFEQANTPYVIFHAASAAEATTHTSKHPDSYARPRQQDELAEASDILPGNYLNVPSHLRIISNQALVNFIGRDVWPLKYYNYEAAFKINQRISHPDDLIQEMIYLDEMLAGQRSHYRMEKRFIHTDSSLRWGDINCNITIDDNNNFVMFVSTVQDITETKRAQMILERALREREQSEQKFRTFFEESPTPCVVISVLPPTSQLEDLTNKANNSNMQVVANKAFKAFLGYDTWQLSQVPFKHAYKIAKSISHPEDWELEQAYLQDMLTGTRQHYSMEKRFIHQDGSLRWGTMNSIAMYDAHGKFVTSLATVQDITQIKQAQLELNTTLKQLEQAYEDAVRALGLMLEYRDDETKGHTDRVTDLALRMATALKLSAPEQTALKYGAYLHDIGKIAVPDAILRKASKLTSDEWQHMCQHSELGYKFVRQLSFLPQAARDIVLYHHEKVSGKGYPNGLQGNNIPLLARIFALADVYDALTSKRCYKPAWSHETALQEINALAGSHFDPELVSVFMTIFD
ncbi:MAG: HD domain-containing phosphohydrolase [Deinococcota bacterium]